MSKHICPVFAVPETAVALTAGEKVAHRADRGLFLNNWFIIVALSVGEGVAAFGGDRRGSAGVSAEEKVKVVWKNVQLSCLYT
jgi:hypothetical protein